MYVHAYQSYVWNAIVSERIRTYGAEHPIAGDLVFDNTPEEDVSMPSAEDEVPAADGENADGGDAGTHIVTVLASLLCLFQKRIHLPALERDRGGRG